MASKIYSIRLNALQLKIFKAQAYARRMTMSRMVTESLFDYFEKNPLTSNQKAIYNAYLAEEEDNNND